MIRVYIPGIGFSLRVVVTTNGHSWTAGLVNTVSRAVETAEAIIPASKIKRVRYRGSGTWLPPDEVRAAVLILSAVAGLDSRSLWDLAHEGTGLDPRRHLRGRSRKPISVTHSQSVTDSPWEEIPSGLHSVSLDREERRRLALLEASELHPTTIVGGEEALLVGSNG